ncbi:MAG: phosphoglucosamine mutase, partial [Coriobacteriia bacterium]|nr:phosphoglucosamine mutase [Coriobacteriia bacterium]
TTVMSNLGLEVAMRGLGVNVIKTKVGDRYVLDQMRTSGASLGGEQSGHVIFLEHNTTGDGLVSAIHLAAIIKRTGKPLSELRKVMQRFPQVLVNVPVADSARLSISAAVHDAVRAAEERLGENGRVLVRPSGTEPLIRVMAEATDQATASEVVDSIVAAVKRELG